MPEQYENQLRDFSFYDSMSTDALERLLRADAQKLDDDIDIDAILYITDLLHERSVKNNEYTVDVDAMLRSMPFYTGPKDVVAPEDEAAVKPKAMTELKKRKTRSILRRCALVAAIVCILFLMSGVASAFGFDVWERLTLWSDELFELVNKNIKETNEQAISESKQEILEYSSLQEALDAIGIDTVNDPALSEREYALGSINVLKNEADTIVYADYCFTDDDSSFVSVCIRKISALSGSFYEKNDDENVELFEVSDIQCYAFSNNNNLSIVWETEGYECRVIGNIPMVELKKFVETMLHS